MWVRAPGQQAAGAGEAGEAGDGGPSTLFCPHWKVGDGGVPTDLLGASRRVRGGPGKSGRRRLWVQRLPTTLLLAGCQLPHGTPGLHVCEAEQACPFPLPLPSQHSSWKGLAQEGPRCGWGMRSGYTDRCSHRHRRDGAWLPTGGPAGSLGQGLENGIHLFRHSCQGKFKLVLGRAVGGGSREGLVSAQASRSL